MEETNQTLADEEGEETIIAPRFDDEETVLARPVVPLGEVDDAPAETPSALPANASRPSTTPSLHSRLRTEPRRSLVAVLVLVSALVGSALGVGGLYLYQKQRNVAAEPTTEQKAETTAPVAQPTVEAESQNQATNTQAPEPQASAPVAPDTNARDDSESDSAKNKGSKKDEESPVVERREESPVVERRNASEDRDAAATQKRDKKGGRDEEARREERRARRDDEQSARDDDDAPDRREARRVGVITYRPRRAGPRRGPYADADRLRRIFEGQP